MLTVPMKLAGLTLAAVLAGASVPARGQAAAEYPTRPVSVVVTAPPGGIVDGAARAVSAYLTRAFKQPVLVDNKAGAGGTIASGLVARAAPDGHTLLMAADSHAVTSMLYKLPYDPVKDLAPVALVGTQPLILLAGPAVSARTLPELVALAKARPESISFASTGTASSSRLTAELFKGVAGIDMTHIPYKGGAPAMNDLIGGQVQVMFIAAGTALAHIKSGKVRALAVTSPERIPTLPDVPTISSYYPNFEALAWIGLLAPAGTPQEIVHRLNLEIAKAVQTPELRAYLESQAMSPRLGTPAQFADWIKSESLKYGEIIRARSIKVE